MSGSSGCTVYIGNLDEKVSDRVLYDILIQAGRVVDLHIPRDKETDKPKGYAFAEYESEEIADYAVKLFSGLVTLCNRTLKFAISGQDKASLPNGHMSAPSLAHKLRSSPMPINNVDTSYHSMTMSTTSRISNISSNYSQVPLPPGVSHYSNGYGSPFNGINYDIGRRDFGSPFDSTNHSRLHSYDTSYFMP